MPAGSPPPAPASLADAGIVHAVDGDLTALCTGNLSVEQVDLASWSDVPEAQQCHLCAMVLGS